MMKFWKRLMPGLPLCEMLPVRFATPFQPQLAPYRELMRCFSEKLWSTLASSLLEAPGVLPWANQLLTRVNGSPGWFGAGKYLSNACAILFRRPAGMMFPGMGLRIVFPLASTKVLAGSKIGTRLPLPSRVSEKSPANCCAVGTLAVCDVALRLLTRSKSVKKKVRF